MELEIILMFRELGFFISDIKAYLDNCNANKFLEIAENKLDYINNEINNTSRLGFSRRSFEEIEKGIKIIGDTIKELPIDD